MVTFPSPWTRDELTFTRWPGPATIRYRSVVCRARTFSARAVGKLNAPITVVWKCWRAEDPDLAEAHGLPRQTPEVAYGGNHHVDWYDSMYVIFDRGPVEFGAEIQWSTYQGPRSFHASAYGGPAVEFPRTGGAA